MRIGDALDANGNPIANSPGIIRNADNIMMNAFYISISGSLSYHGMTDGVIDAFEDTDGIGSNTNMQHDAVNKLYSVVPSGYSANYPVAYNTTYVKGLSSGSQAQPVHQTFNPALSLTGSSSGTQWDSGHTGVLQANIQIDCGASYALDRIYYQAAHYSGAPGSIGIKDFTLWGTDNAGAFAVETYGVDTNWNQITPADLSQTYFNQHVAADQSDPRYITIANQTAAYQYWRLKISTAYGDNHIENRHIEFQSLNPSAGGSLISVASTALSAPSSVRVNLYEEDITEIALNTDLIISVSRDGGTTWTAAALVITGTYEPGKNILSATVDVSGQPSGTSMKWKAVIASTKDCKLRGVGLTWD